jgi:PAS domain S-box-containing protein
VFNLYVKDGHIRVGREEEFLDSVANTLAGIINRKRVEDALRESQRQQNALLDNIPDIAWLKDKESRFIAVNEPFGKSCGFNPKDLFGKTDLDIWSRDLAERYRADDKEVMESGKRKQVEEPLTDSEGKSLWIETIKTPIYDEQGTVIGTVGIARDITERKRAEEALRESEEKYRSIVENAQEGIYQTTPEGRFITVNRAMADMLGYGSPEEFIASFTDIAHQLYVNPEDRTKLRRMVEEHGSVKGFETQFYRKDGNWIWVSIHIRAVHDTNGRVLYYEGINEDITIRKQAEDERKQSFERLRRALRATIQAVAMTVERRDPYTAGHQRRVADLARAIATEMNLSSDQIDGIRMAAIIHDLGKISVPAEILSKPSALTDLEFGIIKTHAQSGYDILKDVEFPWPIARMVLEHHERMDGSGYPKGLVAEETLLESRIMAVADVVESMASHRPYRPALGIDAALEEIENNRGTHYDTSTVDACLRIFRENGYQLIKGT